MPVRAGGKKKQGNAEFRRVKKTHQSRGSLWVFTIKAGKDGRGEGGLKLLLVKPF